MENRFTEIETKVAYLEKTIDELNGVVTKQQDQIDLLNRQMVKILAEIQPFLSQIRDRKDETPPPHF